MAKYKGRFAELRNDTVAARAAFLVKETFSFDR
jgi:hypothetical protein